MSKPILKIKNLNVEFPLFGGILQQEVASVRAVKNLSMEIPQGKTIDLGRFGDRHVGGITIGPIFEFCEKLKMALQWAQTVHF